MAAKRFIMNAGRTSKQGQQINVGKDHAEYQAIVNTLVMHADDMKALNLLSGASVRVRSEYGEAVFPGMQEHAGEGRVARVAVQVGAPVPHPGAESDEPEEPAGLLAYRLGRPGVGGFAVGALAAADYRPVDAKLAHVGQQRSGTACAIGVAGDECEAVNDHVGPPSRRLRVPPRTWTASASVRPAWRTFSISRTGEQTGPSLPNSTRSAPMC